MKYLLKLLGIYLAFLAQSLIFENIKILSCSPDILIVAIIMCAVSAETLPAAFLGATAGMIPNLVGFFREIVFYNRNEKKWASTPISL